MNFSADINLSPGSESACRPDNSSDLDCSGRGNCICNQCDCTKRPNPEEVISGKYCECDNFSCDRSNGILCAGPDHGTCQCGNCVCQPGWSGAACDCLSANTTCIAPNDEDRLCSGRGLYCDKCPTCSGRCNDFKDCVQCQQYKNGKFDQETCAQNCSQFVPIEYDVIIGKFLLLDLIITYAYFKFLF